MRNRSVEIKEKMTINEIEKALYSNVSFETIYNDKKVEFIKPDVRNNHNRYYWVQVNGVTVLKKANVETVICTLINL